MEIFCILVFGAALLRTAFPFIDKRNYQTTPKFIGIFVNFILYLVAYIWFLNHLLN